MQAFSSSAHALLQQKNQQIGFRDVVEVYRHAHEHRCSASEISGRLPLRGGGVKLVRPPDMCNTKLVSARNDASARLITTEADF